MLCILSVHPKGRRRRQEKPLVSNAFEYHIPALIFLQDTYSLPAHLLFRTDPVAEFESEFIISLNGLIIKYILMSHHIGAQLAFRVVTLFMEPHSIYHRQNLSSSRTPCPRHDSPSP